MIQTWQSIKRCCLRAAHQTNHLSKVSLIVALAISCTTHRSHLMPLQELTLSYLKCQSIPCLSRTLFIKEINSGCHKVQIFSALQWVWWWAKPWRATCLDLLRLSLVSTGLNVSVVKQFSTHQFMRTWFWLLYLLTSFQSARANSLQGSEFSLRSTALNCRLA